MNISNDTQATLLLCSDLGSPGTTKPLTPGEYHRLAVALHQHNQRPADLLTAVADELPEPQRLRDLLGRGRLLGLALTRWADFAVWIASRADSDYPARLRRLRGAAPPLLFGVGPRAALERGGLAVVGARDASNEALTFTRTIATRAAEQGVQIVSGAARGVDLEAQNAALALGGRVVALPATSLLAAVAERAHREAIRDGQLTLATPFDPEHGFSAARAMGRNRYIYTLAERALVVCFTTGDGGTWAGAVEQLRHNRLAGSGTPLFVREAGNPAEGLAQLVEQGAHVFPEEAALTGDLVDVLTRAETPS